MRHAGMVAGFVASFDRAPAEEAAVILFANRYRVSSAFLEDFVLNTFSAEGAAEERNSYGHR